MTSVGTDGRRKRYRGAAEEGRMKGEDDEEEEKQNEEEDNVFERSISSCELSNSALRSPTVQYSTTVLLTLYIILLGKTHLSRCTLLYIRQYGSLAVRVVGGRVV